MTAEAWGIVPGYHDAQGTWRETPPETRRAFLAAMGVDGEAPPGPPPASPVLVLRLPPETPPHPAGRPPPGDGPADLILEDGTALRLEGALPPDLPPGYHTLHPPGGGPAIRVIASPGRCHLPEPLRAWGWAVQLYAARSGASWGLGDLADLRRLARWSAGEVGAGFVVVNPLSAVAPVSPQEPSPYFPSSRRFLNPLYLRIEEVPGAAEAGLDLEGLAAAGRALNRERRIDRDAVFRLKRAALERLWARFGGDAGFEAYRQAQGEALAQFATYSALAEAHGGDWRRWPPDYRRADAPAVARFGADQGHRIAFHAWLQWLLDGQLARAAAELPLMADLPIGFDPGGADAWVWQDLLAPGVAVGAPPDGFNVRGQDWAIPPFIPVRLRAAGYGPFIQTIRATLRHARGLRMDHVMGLFRLFWIPAGGAPAQGTYVRYPADELLAIVALESHRGRALIVGEDLGTVEDGVREQMAAHGILSTRILCFEEDPPARFPALALASFGTHDLPTIAGLWTGAELEAQDRLGPAGNPAGVRYLEGRLRALAGLPADAPVEAAIEAVHRALARAPSALLAASLEDACAARERPNVPGTTAQWPNWSLALPRPLEALETDPLPRAIARALARRP